MSASVAPVRRSGSIARRTERPWVAVEYIGVNPLENFVGFKLALDLRQERLGYRFHHAENGDRNFGIAEHFPNGARESDDGRFVVEPRPQIDIAVRVALYLAAAVEQPRVFCVLAPEQDGQKEIAIVAAEQRKVAGQRREFSRRLGVPRGGLLVIESEQFLLNEFCQPFIARIAIALTP